MGGSKWIAVVAGVVLLAGAGGLTLLYANKAGPFKDSAPAAGVEAKSDLARFAVGPLASLQTPAVLTPAPDHVFKDAQGRDVRLADFRGRVVVVNLWAMWCAPCRAEMPTLAALARSYEADPDLIVLPINVDATPDGVAQAKAFIDAHAPLPFYNDIRFQLPFEFPGKGMMPQTILLDRQGRIRASLAGDADWNSAEARALIDALLAEGAPAA